MSGLIVEAADLRKLRAWTEARLALGRVGASMPTVANLDFGADHAAARDAVHAPLNVKTLATDLQHAGFQTMAVTSRVTSRAQYLRRPDLGRRLDTPSAEALVCERTTMPRRLTVVVCDGLSSAAAQRYGIPVLQELRARLTDWTMDTVVIAEQARVALGDEVGALRNAEAVLVLLGERPGLKSPESLGAYLTYAPRVGTTDALRNCVSNIRAGGLSVSLAVTKLVYLLNGARALGQSGVALKENAALSELPARTAGLPDFKRLKGLFNATETVFDHEATANAPTLSSDNLL